MDASGPKLYQTESRDHQYDSKNSLTPDSLLEAVGGLSLDSGSEVVCAGEDESLSTTTNNGERLTEKTASTGLSSVTNRDWPATGIITTSSNGLPVDERPSLNSLAPETLLKIIDYVYYHERVCVSRAERKCTLTRPESEYKCRCGFTIKSDWRQRRNGPGWRRLWKLREVNRVWSIWVKDFVFRDGSFNDGRNVRNHSSLPRVRTLTDFLYWSSTHSLGIHGSNGTAGIISDTVEKLIVYASAAAIDDLPAKTALQQLARKCAAMFFKFQPKDFVTRQTVLPSLEDCQHHALSLASFLGNQRMVRHLLDQGLGLDQQPSHVFGTPLESAIHGDHEHLVEFLITRDSHSSMRVPSSSRIERYRARQCAAYWNRPEIYKLLTKQTQDTAVSAPELVDGVCMVLAAAVRGNNAQAFDQLVDELFTYRYHLYVPAVQHAVKIAVEYRRWPLIRLICLKGKAWPLTLDTWAFLAQRAEATRDEQLLAELMRTKAPIEREGGVPIWAWIDTHDKDVSIKADKLTLQWAEDALRDHQYGLLGAVLHKTGRHLLTRLGMRAVISGKEDSLRRIFTGRHWDDISTLTQEDRHWLAKCLYTFAILRKPLLVGFFEDESTGIPQILSVHQQRWDGKLLELRAHIARYASCSAFSTPKIEAEKVAANDDPKDFFPFPVSMAKEAEKIHPHRTRAPFALCTVEGLGKVENRGVSQCRVQPCLCPKKKIEKFGHDVKQAFMHFKILHLLDQDESLDFRLSDYHYGSRRDGSPTVNQLLKASSFSFGDNGKYHSCHDWQWLYFAYLELAIVKFHADDLDSGILKRRPDCKLAWHFCDLQWTANKVIDILGIAIKHWHDKYLHPDHPPSRYW